MDEGHDPCCYVRAASAEEARAKGREVARKAGLAFVEIRAYPA